jgi:hypothetical protein
LHLAICSPIVLSEETDSVGARILDEKCHHLEALPILDADWEFQPGQK